MLCWAMACHGSFLVDLIRALRMGASGTAIGHGDNALPFQNDAHEKTRRIDQHKEPQPQSLRPSSHSAH